eukprot:sb/3464653/
MLLERPLYPNEYHHTFDSYSSYSTVLGDINQVGSLFGKTLISMILMISNTCPPPPHPHETEMRVSPPQRCSVQTRNVKINTDTVDLSAYAADSKGNKSWLGRLKKSIIGRGQSKKKIKDPSVTRTRAEVTTDEPTTTTPATRPSRPATLPSAPPTAPEPSPEPTETMIEYEPETKPKPQTPQPPSSIYPTLPHPSPQPVQQSTLSPAHITQQVFGTLPVPPNVPFMVYSFPYGVTRPDQAVVHNMGPDGGGGGGFQGGPLPGVGGFQPGMMPPIPEQQQITRRREKRRKEGPHECIDPVILSHDLIRHVKRSCGLNSGRSRTAARAIVQCLEDGIPESSKIHILSEVLSAMDSTFREHRTTETKRKRTRAAALLTLNEEQEQEAAGVKRHSCKRTLKEEKILMDYLQQTLEILEEMSESADKSNPDFHMLFNLANKLLETMFDKLARK